MYYAIVFAPSGFEILLRHDAPGRFQQLLVSLDSPLWWLPDWATMKL
jgi:hypothetical protein